MTVRSCALRTRDKGGRGHKLEVRPDLVSNALTSVTKDFLVIEDAISKGDVKLTQTNEVKYENTTTVRPFKYVSLFSGIGGFEQALNTLGGECVLASEIDKFANQSYEALYGEPTAGDITEIDAKDVPDHDLLVGGFPCQAFSVAGKRLGFEDTRGTLFFEVARIAATKQPRALLLENVKGLVGHDKGRTLDVIVQTLNDIGYTVDFNVLNSKYFGVPQNRERIFIIAMRDDLVTPEPWVIEGNTVVPKGKRRISAYEGVKTFNFDWPEQGEVAARLRDVLEAQVDEKYYLSEEKTAALVAQLNEKGIEETNGINVVGNLKPTGCTRIGQRDDVWSAKGIAGTLNASDYKQPRPIAEEIQPQMLGSLNHYGNDQMNRVYGTDGVAPTLTVPSGGGWEQKIAEYIAPKYRIRKLTPLECFRLQGFSDEAHATLVNAGISDSQRYKQAGNAVTVNVIKALGERLIDAITSPSDKS